MPILRTAQSVEMVREVLKDRPHTDRLIGAMETIGRGIKKVEVVRQVRSPASQTGRSSGGSARANTRRSR